MAGLSNGVNNAPHPAIWRIFIMLKQEIIDKLRNMMKRSSQAVVDWDSVSEKSTIESLGFDSLSILDLVYDIQHEFKLDFNAEEMVNIRTVGDLADFLKNEALRADVSAKAPRSTAEARSFSAESGVARSAFIPRTESPGSSAKTDKGA